jgi:hypothetical protein
MAGGLGTGLAKPRCAPNSTALLRHARNGRRLPRKIHARCRPDQSRLAAGSRLVRMTLQADYPVRMRSSIYGISFFCSDEFPSDRRSTATGCSHCSSSTSSNVRIRCKLGRARAQLKIGNRTSTTTSSAFISQCAMTSRTSPPTAVETQQTAKSDPFPSREHPEHHEASCVNQRCVDGKPARRVPPRLRR